ncbi:hypothetical protein QM012_007952 [Aureobasidium pullulans]|uniref:Uncharacterized protein n=1 Tax=Aureobasidium pullulans TaxID=5580 RepID=A0ABR0TL47_AURPU
MDNAARNLRGIVEDVQSPSAGLLDFPSPASDLEIYTPGVGSLSLTADVTSNPWPGSDACLSSATSAIPDTARPQPSISTPAHEFEQPGLGFDALVGARVAPAPTSPPPLTSLKDSRDLRLPSFTKLGIAAPHSEPVRPSLTRNPHPCLGGDDSAALPRVGTVALGEKTKLPADHSVDDVLLGHVDAIHPESSSTVQPRAPLHSPMHHYVTTLTPPDDSGRITWEAITQFATGPMTSPMAASGGLASAAEASAASEPEGSAIPSINVQVSTPMEEPPRPWLKDAITIMLENIRSASNAYQDPIKVLSHALPCPSTEGHAFPTIISSLHDETPTSPTCWINVFHALPGRFNLADLPTSPPSTPGPPIGGDDYFTSKVFDSAVHILDYADNLKSLPQSPRPVVPPSSVDVSIVERYIPPTNKNEFADMFTTKGPSLLVDRLVELSPDNGTLIFVYPTKRGAQTFVNEYLGPILDPILRSMVVVNGFSSDMGQQLGKMVAVDELPDHDMMKRKIMSLCSSLSQSSPGMERFQKLPTNFELLLSTTEEVILDRKVWSQDWWAKQEKPRIRETISRFFRKANRAQEDQTPVSLVHEVLDGVAQKAYPEGKEKQSGIEVSVFVISRSRCAK